MSPEDPPTAPNAAQSYGQGLQTYLSYVPTMLQGEQDARGQYDPQRIAEQQALQSYFGQNQYSQQLDALHQLDPASAAIRNQLANAVSSDLSSGYNMPDAERTELLNQYRGAQTARGNDLGVSAGAGEASYLGQAAIGDYQRRITNAGNFLSSPTPEQQLLAVQPVTPDRSSQYVNPNAGYAGQQFALSNYQNQLAQYQLAGGGTSPWASAASGAAGGALAGSSFGPYGAVIGGVAGGAAGYFSDSRTKENVVDTGTRNGVPLIEFNYKFSKTRFKGVRAEDVMKIAPHAIKRLTGYLSHLLAVDYDMLGIKLEAV